MHFGRKIWFDDVKSDFSPKMHSDNITMILWYPLKRSRDIFMRFLLNFLHFEQNINRPPGALAESVLGKFFGPPRKHSKRKLFSSFLIKTNVLLLKFLKKHDFFDFTSFLPPPPLDFRVAFLWYRGPIRIYSYDKIAISRIYHKNIS